MGQFDELEDRLRAAVMRIEAASGQIPDPSEGARAMEEASALRAQLDEERSTNAQLIERVQALKERQETKVAQLEDDLAKARTRDAEQNAVQQELKNRIEELRDQVARLTEANRAQVSDPSQINTAMMAELEAMRASRRADMSEIDDILAQLEPHLGGGAHA